MRKTNFLITIIVMSSFLSMYIPPVRAARYQPFIVGISDTPYDIDPANAFDGISYRVLDQVYEGLYAYNLSSPNKEIIPRLSSKMGIWNENITELTVELREDVTFHDGSAFNATAVKWNFDRINNFAAEKKSDPYLLYLNNEGELIVKETVVVDEYTVKFILNKPFSIWEKMLAISKIMKPNDAFETEFITLLDPTIGTGPFKLIEVEPDNSVTFERFEEYYKSPANISKMVYNVITDSKVASIAMLNHELHYGILIGEHIETAEADPDISIDRIKILTVSYLTFNVNHIPYELRRALSFAFNYSYFLDETLNGLSYELHTPIPDGMEYHNPDIEGLPYYNLTIARDYILNSEVPSIALAVENNGLDELSTTAEWQAAAAGDYPIDKLNYTRFTSNLNEKIKDICTDNFAYVGVKVLDHHVGDWGTWVEWAQIPENKALLDISLGAWGPDYDDAINMIEPLLKENATYNNCEFANETIDGLMSDNYELIGAEREASFNDLVYKIMVENAPLCYLRQWSGLKIYNNKYVSNMNIYGGWYWYNVKYTPEKISGIPGFTLSYTLLVSLGVVALFLIRFGKRN